MQIKNSLLKIVHQLPSSGSSADLRLIGMGEDQHQYALKTLADSPFLPISEWVGYHLCQSLNIRTPEFAIVKLLDNSLAFGSRWDFSVSQLPKVISTIELTKYFGIQKKVIAEIYAADLFLPNENRHGRNLLFIDGPDGKFPLAFDFPRAWISLGLPFGVELTTNTQTLNWWNFLKN